MLNNILNYLKENKLQEVIETLLQLEKQTRTVSNKNKKRETMFTKYA